LLIPAIVIGGGGMFFPGVQLSSYYSSGHWIWP